MSRALSEKVPVELWHMILCHLQPTDLFSLRLTSSTLKAVVTSFPGFLALFSCQRTDLTTASLHRLRDLVSSPFYTEAVKHIAQLTIEILVFDITRAERRIETAKCEQSPPPAYFGMAPDGPRIVGDLTDVEVQEATDDHAWVLAQAREAGIRDKPGGITEGVLTGILRQMGRLEILRLTAACLRGRAREADNGRRELRKAYAITWSRLGRGYGIVLESVRSSEVEIADLDIYGETRWAGVRIHDIIRTIPTWRSAKRLLNNLSGLSLCVRSTSLQQSRAADSVALEQNFDEALPVVTSANAQEQSRYHRPSRDQSPEDHDLDDLAELLRSTPQLHKLSLRRFRSSRSLSHYRSGTLGYNFFFPALQHLSIRGLTLSQKELTALLRGHASTLRTLELGEISLLEQETWNPVLTTISLDVMPQLQQVRLSNLWGSRLLNLCAPGVSWEAYEDTKAWATECGRGMVHTRTLRREDGEIPEKGGLRFAPRPTGTQLSGVAPQRWLHAGRGWFWD